CVRACKEPCIFRTKSDKTQASSTGCGRQPRWLRRALKEGNMTRIRFGFVLGLAGVLFATTPRAFAVAEQQPLPRNLSEDERAEMDRMDQLATPGGGYFWQCYPDVAGFTVAPPSDSRFPGEFEN